MNVIVVVGFLFFGVFTARAYQKLKSRMLLFICLAYFTLAVSDLLVLVLLPQAGSFGIDPEYIEASVEAVQFLAALFFFIGLRLIKPKKVEATVE